MATAPARFWYVDHAGRLGPLDETKTVRHRTADPDAYLARLAIIAEGKTEVGFASALLEKALSSPLERHGVHVSDGEAMNPLSISWKRLPMVASTSVDRRR